jgi:N-acetylated-alpha-linked acidic dipeptidase
VAEPLNLEEQPLASDPDSASTAAFPAFHGYGVSGQVSGQVVYANYGRPEDFDAIAKLGIDLQGKVVLVRYGGNFRGLKVRNAQLRKASGVLIYSDPGDDGYARGDVFPAGPYRPGSAVQLGSVQFLSLGPGDPSTPFGASLKGANRLPIDPRSGFPRLLNDVPGGNEASVSAWEKASGLKRDEYFATIPSLPIGYDAAKKILEVLAGPNVPSGWQGGLPLAYHVGPGPAEVEFRVEMDYRVRPIWNVIATIPGTVEPDQWVLIGNHRDAWIYGAVDPGSGTAATLEMCRAIGEAVKRGWKPRRTLVYASWDAEEYGLVGSTEWAEQHAAELDQKAVLMLNVDSAVSGTEPDFDGVPSLRDLLLGAAASVTDPRTGRTVESIWMDAKRKAWAQALPLVDTDPAWTEAESRVGVDAATFPHGFVPQLAALGSGSDYTAFLDHLGIPAIDVGFSGRYGVYHSIYDDITWMERHGDPEFLTHTTAAKLYTLVAMRAAGAEVLPLTFTPYGASLRSLVDEMRLLQLRKSRARPEPAETESTANSHAIPPLPEKPAGIETLLDAVVRFQAAAAELDQATAKLVSQESIRGEQLVELNRSLATIERSFLLEDGLPGRPWFRHAVYAPGLTTGYACWPLPGLRQAIEENDATKWSTELPRTVVAIDHAREAITQALKQARALLPSN